MKRKNTFIFYLTVVVVTTAFVLLIQHVSGQTYVPITNNHNGISIGIQGTPGTDYVFDRYYHDPLINDCGLCYIKSDVDITLAHNSNNSRVRQNNITEIIGGDFGTIRYKVDRDWQEMYWGGDNGQYAQPDWNFYPMYAGPVSFDDMQYEAGVPVVGTTGFNPGVPVTDRDNSYSRGLLDAAGNEYHYFTYADDDDQDPAWKNLEMSASDGKSMLFCVNPKTPAIWLSAAATGAQYYTTPGKVYWVPKFHEQTSYVMDNVDINLKNIMNSNTVYYRIDGGSYQAYTGAISSNMLSDGEHILEFYYDPTYVQTRKIVKNPDHPSKQDVFEDGSGHGYILWKNEAEVNRWRSRVLSGGCKSGDYNFYKSKMGDVLNWGGNQGIRNPAISSDPFVRYSLMLVLVPVAEGAVGNENYLAAAKRYLLNTPRMHIENIGFETNHAFDPNPCHELTYRGYYDDWLLFSPAFIYDYLAKEYRSDQRTGGMTPIEDLRIRDMLAVPVLESMMNFGGYSMKSTAGTTTVPTGGMWTTARQSAALCAALAMPSYNTHYLGTSGFDGTQAAHDYTPYPDYPESWKDLFLTYTDKDNPAHAARLHPFPERESLFNWYDGTMDEGLVREDGNWHDRIGYADDAVMGHGIEIFYNVMKRKFNMTYPNLDAFMMNSVTGTLVGHKFSLDTDYDPQGFPRRNMANEYFPALAPIAMTAYDDDNKYFYAIRPYGIIFNNPEWATVTICESTTPPTVPTNLAGTPDETTVALSWTASTHTECGVSGYKVYRNGVEVATPNGTNYTDGGLTRGVQYQYEVAAVSEAGVISAKSSAISVTTLTDDILPAISNVITTNYDTELQVVFSEDVELASAETIANYSIDNGISISSAQLQPDNNTVVFTVSPLSEGITYTITVNNVEDLNGNAIAANSTSTFQYVEPTNHFNVAFGKSVSCSGEQAGNEAVKLVDGNKTDDYRWSVENYPQWAVIDLGENHDLSRMELTTTWSRDYQYIIEVSTDGTNYATVVDRSANTQGGTIVDYVSTTARYVKLTATGAATYGGTWISINELEVYGLPGDPVAATGVSVSPATLTINQGQTSDLTETVSPADASNKTVTWTTSNAAVATVDAGGLVTAVAEGSAIITATTNDGGFTATCNVTVNAVVVTGYFCDPANGSMANDGSQASPWSTLEAVFAAGKTFVPGDIINLMNGHHGDPQITGNSAGNDYITIKALAGHTPVVKGLGFTDAHKWKVEGIDVNPNEYISAKVGGNDHHVACDIDGNSSFITFDGCHFYSKLYSETTGWSQDDWYYWTWVMIEVDGDDCNVKNSHFEVVDMAVQALGARLTIENNLIEYITEDGIRALGDYIIIKENTIQEMVYCGRTEDHNDAIQSFCMIQDGYHAVTGVQIIRNTIKAYNDKNRDHIEYMQCLGLFDGWFDNWVIRENVIFGSHWHGISFLGARNCEIVNNTVVKLDGALYGDPGIRVQDLKSSGGNYASYTGSRESTNNIIRNNISCNLSVIGSTNINENNLILSQADYPNNFVDWLNTDGHLIASSVAINAGTNTGVSNTDIEGNTRIYNGTVDQGAYEFISGATVAVTDVTVNPTSLTIEVGQTSYLAETVSPTNASDKSVVWSSGNTSIATVDATGMVTAVATGNTIITVTTIDGGYTANCSITVNPYVPPTGWVEDFSGLANGTTVDNGATAWTTVGGSVQNGEFRTGGAAATHTWTSETIDITGATSVDISIDVAGIPNGGDGMEATDYIKTFYQIDGGAWIEFSNNVDEFAFKTESVTGLSGNSIALKAESKVSAADEFYYIDNVVVTINGSSAVAVIGVSVSPITLTFDEGQTSDLTETVIPVDATDKSVVWSTSNASVATVDANGLVTAVTDGSATITVTTIDGGYAATCNVTVNGIFVNSSPTIDAVSNLTIPDDAGQQIINLTGIGDGDGNTQAVSVTAISSNINIADNVSVNYTSGNTTGTITFDPVAAGTATITITVSDDGGTLNGGIDTKIISFDITVQASVVNVTGVSLTQSTLTLGEGLTSSLNETVSPANATDKSVTWSTSDANIATVDANGLVTAIAAGNATITVTTTDGGFTATCGVTVVVPSSSGLAESVGTGTAGTINGYTGWDNGSPIVYSGGSPSDGYNIVQIGEPSDTYTGASGESNVKLKGADDGTPGWLLIEGINTAGLNDITLSFGLRYYSVTAILSFAVYVSTDGTNWTQLSKDNSFPAGSTWGLMSYSNLPATSDLRIKFEVTKKKDIWLDDIKVEGSSSAIPVTGVSISQSTLTLDEGQTSDLDETVSPANASDPSVVWSTSNAAIATVNASGLVTAVSAGTAIISVTTNDGGYAAACNVTVNVPEIDVTGVSISQSTLTLDEGQTSDLDETVTPANASDPSVVWSTSNAAIAAVNASGLVTAVSAGTAIITVTTNDGGYTAACNVTVNVPVIDVDGVSISQSTLTLDEGQTSDLDETVTPANASDPSVVWSTSNAAIATVNASGVVSALSAGQAIITVTTNDGGFTASCDVTVNSIAVGGLVETCGTGTASTIGGYTGWDNAASIAFSGYNTTPGYNKVDATVPSTGYAGASGGSYAAIAPGYTETAWFIIDGINTLGMTNIELNFGIYYYSVTATINFEVSYSTDGTNWTVLSNSSFPGVETWGAMTYTGLPAASNLRIKFEETARKSVFIDDITVSENSSKSLDISKVNNAKSEVKINTYPNPVDGDVLNVEISGIGREGKAIFQIVDITGRVVSIIQKQVGHDSQFIELSLGNVKSGSYILHIMFEKKSYMQKVIVR